MRKGPDRAWQVEVAAEEGHSIDAPAMTDRQAYAHEGLYMLIPIPTKAWTGVSARRERQIFAARARATMLDDNV